MINKEKELKKLILIILLSNCIKFINNIKNLNKNINQDLINASKTGNVEEVKILLEKGADTNHRDDNSRLTSLLYASRNGYIEIVKLLIEKGANVNEKSAEGCAALVLASEKGHMEIVKLLIEKGADVNSADNFGDTVLKKASYNGQLEIVKILIEKGANVHNKNAWGITALSDASRKGYLEIVKLLTEKGANINFRDPYYDTALIHAAGGGHVDVVKFFLDNKAISRYIGYKGRTALTYAIEEMKMKWNANKKDNYTKTIRMLLKEMRIEYILINEVVIKNNMNKKLTYIQEENLKCLQEQLCILESLLKLPIEILGEVVKYL